MGPIGVVLGMVVKQVAPPVVDALMLATVAGTFIYVGATEVIPEEWEDQVRKGTPPSLFARCCCRFCR